jgi:hypothetical protein
MKRMSGVVLSILVAVCVLIPETVRAQEQPGGIAGVVKDPSGAVLPGVTVEAASPALIEKVRTAVTDSQGQYKIIDLRPGTYTVTFSLTGFNTIRREGIELTTGFTANVSPEMKVGSLEETITVTGASPLVDTQNIRQQQVVSSELLTALPTSTKGLVNLTSLIPGMLTSGARVDVGGSGSIYYATDSNSGDGYHGKGVGKVLFDGMRISNLEIGGHTSFVVSATAVQEVTVQTGGLSAESNASGTTTNLIPKDGSNKFTVTVGGVLSASGWQSDNLSDEIRARGLTTVNDVKNIHDINGTLGGPIAKDRLWFFTSQRQWGNRSGIGGLFYNKTQGTPFYTPDLTRPFEVYETYRSHAGRLNWQASRRNKVNFFVDFQDDCICRGGGEFRAPEAAYKWVFYPNALYQATWNMPVTNKLLLEAGFSLTQTHYQTLPQPETAGAIATIEASTGFAFNAQSAFSYGPVKKGDRYAQRAAVSYVTGSHAFKAGVQIEQGRRERVDEYSGQMIFTVNRGVPTSILQWISPYHTVEIMKADLGAFVQDQWTFKRLTLNPGLRFNYFNSYVPAQSLPAGPWVPARNYPKVEAVPLWKDINPRVGASYDLFGNGRTAIKASLGKYNESTGTNIAQANNPVVTSTNSTSRTWSDANTNFIPDCDLGNGAANGECGPFANQNFGKTAITTRYADDALRGFNHRGQSWEFSTEVQHQLTPQVSVTGGYYRNWNGNFLVSDNVATTAADYTPFCITAPADARLPGGGGYNVCGMYDVSPAKFGQVNNIVSQASNFGKETKVADFFGVGLNTRFRSATFGGGLDTGRIVADLCGVLVDQPTISSTLSPYAITTFGPTTPRQFCKATSPFKGNTQIKLHGSYPLPSDFVVSAIFQNVSGPEITSNYAVPNAAVIPSLGRSLAACGNPARPNCTSIVTVPLTEPGSEFEGRRTQVDLRLTRIFKMASRVRLQANLDVYNVLNGSAVLVVNGTYGSQWRNVQGILGGRLLQLSGELTF